MTSPRKSPTIIPTVGVAQSSLGPREIVYWKILGVPGLFRWAAADDTADDDGATCIELSGGMPGRMLRVREPDRGADLADATTTIYPSEKRWRVLPAATLSRNQTLTLGTTSAVEGDWILVTREDTSAYVFTIANGGAGAGNVGVMPVSQRSWCMGYFDGTNWIHRASGISLAVT